MSQALYVPFIQVIEGDMEGLSHASPIAQGRVCPYFEIVKTRPRKTDRSASFVACAADLIAKTWSHKGPAFVELFDEPGDEEDDWFPSSDHTLFLLHRYLLQQNVFVIPTIALYRTGLYRAAFLVAARIASAGVGIRLYADDLELPSETIIKLRELGSETQSPNSDIDLIINLQRIKPDQLNFLRTRLLDFLATLSREAPYRSITLVGTSIPEKLTEVVPANEERHVLRLELQLWRDVCASLGKQIALGDYLVVRPEYDDRIVNFADINAKIAYTTEESTYLIRGQSKKKERLEDQYRKLARRLVQSGIFQGAESSWGDARIADYAQRGYASGAPKNWIVICIAHHIELVSTQVAREFEHSVSHSTKAV